VTSLVSAGKTEVVVGTVDGNVFIMSLLELLNHRLDDGHTILLVTGTVGRVVGVSSGTVPVALEWFRVERDFDAPFFGTSDEEETSHGHVVTRLDTDARTDLEFPLSGHDFGIDTRNLDARVQASAVVSFNEITSEHASGTDTTVVWTLRSWETALWPAVWCAVVVEKGVFLFNAEPWLFALDLLHELVAVVSVVGLVGGSIRVEGLAQNENVVSKTERIPEDGSRAKEDVRVVASSLVGRGTVKVPFRQVVNALDRASESLGLATEAELAV